jgi:hypothetical protein
MLRMLRFGLLLVMAEGLMAGCSTIPSSSVSSELSASASTSATAAASTSDSPVSSQRASPPAGFPLFPGASEAPVPADDGGVAARWSTGTLGSGAYDFYQRELPRAGFRILGLFPGGGGAVIRLAADDVDWQLEITQVNDRTQISLQTDRP